MKSQGRIGSNDFYNAVKKKKNLWGLLFVQAEQEKNQDL